MMLRKVERTRTLDELYKESAKIMSKQVKKFKGGELSEKEAKNIESLAKVLALGVLKDIRSA